MSSTLSQSRRSDPVRLPDTFGPTTAKAGASFAIVTSDAVIAFYGSVKATAYALGEGAGVAALDPSLMQREFKAGDFKRLQHASVQCMAAVALAHRDAYGPMANSPEQHASRTLDSIQDAVNELRQYVIARSA